VGKFVDILWASADYRLKNRKKSGASNISSHFSAWITVTCAKLSGLTPNQGGAKAASGAGVD
jgi:hypothetical protein